MNEYEQIKVIHWEDADRFSGASLQEETSF